MLFFTFLTPLLSQGNTGGEGEVSFDAEGWKRQNSVLPPSPQAASLGQYGNISVSYHTGSPGINVPLGGIGGKFLSSPVSLSYDANSVKVATIPGWGGLGFSIVGMILNAGNSTIVFLLVILTYNQIFSISISREEVAASSLTAIKI